MEIVRQKNAATIIVFPIVDADGDTVTGATSLDSEIDTWSDGAAPDGFTDCTNEATEIGSTGQYYLSLTQSEMNADYIIVQVKTGTAGAKTQVILIRTMVGDPLNFAVTDDGTPINVASGIVEAQVKSIDNNAITANSIATDAITAAKIAADAIGASELAADAVTEIQSGLSTLTQANIRSAVGLASANLDTQLSTIDDFLDTEIAAIKAKTDNLPSDPADASDIAASFSTVNTKLDTIDDYVDSEVAAIKAVTDHLATAIELDGSVYRFTTNALEQAPSGGATVSDIADAVWDEKVDEHLTDRSYGAKIGIHIPFVAPDFDYKRMQKMIDGLKEQITNLPQPEKLDLTSIADGFQAVIQEIQDLPRPKDPEKFDFTPILNKLDNLAKQVGSIEIPEPVEPNLDPILEKMENTPNELQMVLGQLETIIDRIREFFSGDVEDIKTEVSSIKKELKRIPMMMMSPQEKPDDE